MGRAFSRVLPDGLVVLVVLALTWPMWTAGGYGLARDMVFTPRHPWTLDAIGMGSAAPRAVPLDAVLALATSGLDGAVVFRVAVAGVLLLAGLGAHRLLADLLPDVPLAARCVAAVAAVWNPYVVERLALGQWALLAGYAALFWLVPAARRAREGDGRAWAAVVGWSWFGSLTPTGGAALVLVAASLLVVALARSRHRAATAIGLLVALAAQLPWLVAGALGTAAATSDPEGVSVFAARAERGGGAWPTLLGTGGVWSPFEVPGSLEGVSGHLLTVVVLVALVVGGRAVVRHDAGLGVAAAVGLLLAGVAHLPGGDDALAWAVTHVPGTGLLRDGQKWLLPYVVLVAASAGAATAAATAALRRWDVDLARLLPGALVLFPVLLMPDAAGRTWTALEPVRYPDDLAEAVAVLDRDDGTGDVATAPWASYRRFSWGNPVSAADPLPRWTHRRTVVSDTLAVTGDSVTGEDPRAREVGRALAQDGPVADRLAALGVGWLLVYRDQPGADTVDTTGATPVVDGPEIALYRVPGVDQDPTTGPGDVAVVTTVTLDGGWAVAGMVGMLSALVMATRRRPAC